MNKRGISGLLISLIILLVVMVILVSTTSNQFQIFDEKISIMSLNKNKINIEIIKNKCELACLEGDTDTYCNTYKLIVSTTDSYKGNCEELSEGNYVDFSIDKCGEITC